MSASLLVRRRLIGIIGIGIEVGMIRSRLDNHRDGDESNHHLEGGENVPGIERY